MDWKHCDIVDAETEKELIARMQEGDLQARSKLIQANVKLASKIANEYRDFDGIKAEDLLQEGLLGVCQAADRFDPDMGTRFTTYAQWWIKANVLRFLLNNFRLVKLGTSMAQRKLFYRLRREQQKLIAQGIEPDAGAIADICSVNPSDVVEMDQRMAQTEVSLTATDTDGNSLFDTLAAEGNPEEYTSNKLQRAWMVNHMIAFEQRLSDIELTVWNDRIASEDPITLVDIGNKLDINEVDALKYYAQDPETQIIAMHIESLHGDVHVFLDLIKSVSRKKPLIILKVGRTQAGSRAAASHTGSIAKENDAIFEGAI